MGELMRKKLWLFVLIFILGGAGLFVWHQNKHGHKTAPSQKQLYQCPMHPNVIKDSPGQCPICGMNLVEVKEQTNSDNLLIDQEKANLLGLQTTVVGLGSLKRTIRATAKVAYDQDLYNALIELREADKALHEYKSSGFSDLEKRTASLKEAAEFKLKVMGIPEKNFKSWLETEQNLDRFLIVDPQSPVWVVIDIYQEDLGFVSAGQQVEFTSSAYPDRTFLGTVLFVGSNISSETRTVKVRAQIPAHQNLLKADMFLEARVKTIIKNKLVVSDECVIRTGERDLVFVQVKEGEYQKREVVVGLLGDDQLEIKKGLEPGEEIIQSANFLIDSESKLKSALSTHSNEH